MPLAIRPNISKRAPIPPLTNLVLLVLERLPIFEDPNSVPSLGAYLLGFPNGEILSVGAQIMRTKAWCACGDFKEVVLVGKWLWKRGHIDILVVIFVISFVKSLDYHNEEKNYHDYHCQEV